ncbi:MAG: histidine phosphatase family protein, partial [Limnobacter sp.]|nr:histidine phosphatase family protein [Limnobacter sp.]
MTAPPKSTHHKHASRSGVAQPEPNTCAAQHAAYCLVRHGETAWNAQKRFQGHIDICLNPTGVQQASLLGEWLQKHWGPSWQKSLDFCVSSDLERASHTARLLLGSHASHLTNATSA